MKKVTSSDKIHISQSKIPGAYRGVFANLNIKRGEIIEICPIIEIPNQEISNIEKSILVNYVYFFGKNKDRMLLALGFGSIYNHSYTPNAEYKIKPSKRIVQFVATQNIKKGEEITVNYSQGNSKRPRLWFE